jgi:type IV pilus assembly protein PilB
MLGQILIAAGALNPEQLQQGLEEQRRHGGLLGEILVGLHFISEEALAKALAQQAHVAYHAVSGQALDTTAAELLPEALAHRYAVAPLSALSGVLTVLQANPFDVTAVDEIARAAGRPVEVVCGTRADVYKLIERSYGSGGELYGLAEEAVSAAQYPGVDVASEHAPIVRLIDALLRKAVSAGATDLHIEPEEKIIRLRHRVDGVLVAVDTLPRELLPPLVSRIKVVSGLDIAEQRMPQDGRITQSINGRVVDMRIATFPTVFGEKVAIRFLEKEKLVRGLEELGFSRKNLVLFKDLLSKSRGMILVTGPTGAGKTTTLYSALNFLGGRAKNILTVEDPVEYEFPSIRQTQVKPKAGFTFAAAIRSILRQDPDVIMVGEIRDPETAQLAVRAALSGVLVFSTLHTQDSVGTIPRLMDMGLEPYLLASAVVGVVAQRLLRVVCPNCKEPITYDVETLRKVNLTPNDQVTFYKGKGCDQCGGTGYHGRTGAFEVLAIDPTLHELIRQRADSRLLKDAAVRAGLKPLLDDALSKAMFGQTSLDEVLRIAYE